MIELTNNPQNPQNNIILDSVDTEFVNSINNRITLYGQIPYNVPQLLIVDAIKQAARFFYEYHPAVTHPIRYLVDLKDFEKTNNLISTSNPNKNINERGMYLVLSPRIAIVKRIYELTGAYNWADMIDENYSNSQIGMTQGIGGGIDTNLFFTEVVTKMVEINGLNSMLKTKIPFKYSQFDHTLYLKAKPATNKIVIDTKAFVHIHNLYNDPYFDRLVYGYAKRELKRLIGGHTFQLPGDVTLNADEICNNLEDIETVEDKIRGMSTMGDVILKRSN